jgi:hypothetical protein
VGRKRSEPSIHAHAPRSGFFLRDNKRNVVELQLVRLNSFLNQVAIAITNMLELGGWNPHEKNSAGDVAEAGGL